MRHYDRFSGKLIYSLPEVKAVFLLVIISFLFQGCIASHSENSSPGSAITEATVAAQKELAQSIIADSLSLAILEATISENEQAEVKAETETEEKEPKETRLKYPDFSVVIHDFKGYEIDDREVPRKYYSQFGGNSDFLEAELNDTEQENEDYTEALVVKKDTLHISEQLFDDRINNTLIQILPKNKTDRFKLSFCYLSTLGEIVDDRNLSREEAEKRYKSAARYFEQTKYYEIKDSAGFYFRAMPHTADMEEVTVKDGKIVPVKERNSKAQLNWEMEQYKTELNRIKKKYQLKDTLVVIPGEYDVTATLTKKKKLFSYGYDAFLFRLQRLNNKKLIETRYIVVSIAYGC